MSDYEWDDEDQSDVDDDWEDAEDKEEEAKLLAAKKAQAEKERKLEEARKKKEKWDRILAARGEMAETEEIDEVDAIGLREYEDRLKQHDVEVEYQETNTTFESQPIETMNPKESDEFAMMGAKIGTCMRTFRSSKFYFVALNRLVTKLCDKTSLDDISEVQKKLNVLVSERTRILKEGEKREAKTKASKYADKEQTEEAVRGNGLAIGSEGRNDLVGDGDANFDDFM
eukprot:TRINITY_DN87_c16_g1_i1.p1 TRINITY_DN87_c16_g1~~TRINITY_DN87_c16_g1_i1.p1  ORF type:complete len:228 (+),score=73.15 TRINITY_DN87_c16_g1_i1:55-738(+)